MLPATLIHRKARIEPPQLHNLATVHCLSFLARMHAVAIIRAVLKIFQQVWVIAAVAAVAADAVAVAVAF